MWVAAVQMPSEAGEEVGFVASGSSSAEQHIVLQVYRSSLHQPPETTQKVFSKVQHEEFKKLNGKKASEVHSFLWQTQISKVSVSLVSKGRVTGPKQSKPLFYINVYRINTYLKNSPTLSWTAKIESYCASNILQCKIKWIILIFSGNGLHKCMQDIASSHLGDDNFIVCNYLTINSRNSLWTSKESLHWTLCQGSG